MRIDSWTRTIAVFDTRLPEFEKYLKTGHYAYFIKLNKIFVFNTCYEEVTQMAEKFHIENIEFVKADDAEHFSNDLVEICKIIVKRLSARSHIFHIDRLIEESMDSQYTGYHRYICRCKLYGK